MFKYCYLLFLSFMVFSQEKMPIQPEETPYLLDKNQFQIETSLGYKEFNNTEMIFISPSVLIKFGFSKFFEIRLITENNVIKSSIDSKNGLLPIIIGFKTKLWKEKKWLPESAIVLQSGLNKIASTNFKTNHLTPEIIWMMQGNYSNNFSVNYNFGAKWDGENQQPYYTHKTTASYLLNPNYTVYSDFFGHFHTNEPSHQQVDLGIMYQLNENMMLDLSNGIGLNVESPKYFCNLVYSIRF